MQNDIAQSPEDVCTEVEDLDCRIDTSIQVDDVDDSADTEDENVSEVVVESICDDTYEPIKKSDWIEFDSAIDLVTSLGITNSNLYNFWNTAAAKSSEDDTESIDEE